VKFGIEYLQVLTFSLENFRENSRKESQTYERKSNYALISYTFGPICTKVGTGNAHEYLWSGDEFRENRSSEKPYLIFRLQLISILLSTFISILGSNPEYRFVYELSVRKNRGR
jgi:hypothetical protein